MKKLGNRGIEIHNDGHFFRKGTPELKLMCVPLTSKEEVVLKTTMSERIYLQSVS